MRRHPAETALELRGRDFTRERLNLSGDLFDAPVELPNLGDELIELLRNPLHLILRRHPSP